MGPLSLPTSGVAYVDASPFIYTVEPHPAYAPLLLPLWQGMASGGLVVVTSELTLMEVLIGAYRKNDATLVTNDLETVGDALIRRTPIDQAVLTLAAQFRGSHPSLRTPDAIHLATAALTGCDVFVTNDKGLRNAPFPNVVVLDDLR